MSAWVDRIPLDRASRALQAAWDAGHHDRALLFHDMDLLHAKLNLLRDTFPSSTLHAIAIKANPLVEILRVLVEGGMGLEAASMEEVQLALAASCPPDRIVYDSPAKTNHELHQALSLGIHVNADGLDELQRIAALGGALNGSVGLRVNPEVGGGRIAMTSTASSTTTNRSPRRFGVPMGSGLSDIVAAFTTYPWLSSLHAHVGSQGCDLDLLVRSAKRLNTLRTQIIQQGGVVSSVDIGGGLPAAYREDQKAPELADYVSQLRKDAPDLFNDEVQLVTEFGRALHAGCGFAASRVEYVDKESRRATLHLGADLLLRPVYRPEDWSHEFAVLDASGRPKAGPKTPWMLDGPLCFAGDVIGRERPLPDIEPGDWVVIRDTGAYTLSMWSRHCSRGIPPVLGWQQDGLSPSEKGKLRVMSSRFGAVSDKDIEPVTRGAPPPLSSIRHCGTSPSALRSLQAHLVCRVWDDPDTAEGWACDGHWVLDPSDAARVLRTDRPWGSAKHCGGAQSGTDRTTEKHGLTHRKRRRVNHKEHETNLRFVMQHQHEQVFESCVQAVLKQGWERPLRSTKHGRAHPFKRDQEALILRVSEEGARQHMFMFGPRKRAP